MLFNLVHFTPLNLPKFSPLIFILSLKFSLKILYQVLKHKAKFFKVSHAHALVCRVNARVFHAKFHDFDAKFSKIPCIARAAFGVELWGDACDFVYALGEPLDDFAVLIREKGLGALPYVKLIVKPSAKLFYIVFYALKASLWGVADIKHYAKLVWRYIAKLYAAANVRDDDF